MKLIDSHAHIHDPEFFAGDSDEQAYLEAIESGVEKIILVGTSLESSKRAVQFAQKHTEHCWSVVGIHPHEAIKLSKSEIDDQLSQIQDLALEDSVVGIGECGFDFYYNDRHECLAKQKHLLEGHFEIAAKYDFPCSFHVREGFEDFWPVFDKFSSVRGVLHSFTDRQPNLKKALDRELFIGVNGIATFTGHKWQQDLYKSLPLSKLLLETDSPFLTPAPVRGNINTPRNVIYITQYLAELRGEAIEDVAEATTTNAEELFGRNNERNSKTSRTPRNRDHEDSQERGA